MEHLPVPLREASRVALHRVHIRPCGERNWLVTRWGGTSMIAVTRQGLDTIGLLKGRTIGEVRAVLRTDRPSTPTLNPLLSVLYRANLVKTIDGTRVSTREVTATTLCRFLYKLFIKRILDGAVRRLLPVRYIPRSLSLLNYLSNPSRMSAQTRMADAHIAAVFQHRSAEFIKAAQRGHLRYLTSVKLDPEMLSHCNARTVDRWLTRHVTVEGMGRLETTLSQSRSAIVSLCHMNQFNLAPLVLLKHGVRICVIKNLQASDTAQRHLEWYRRFLALPGYSDIEIVPNFNFENVRRVIQRMEQGWVVLGGPDAAPPPEMVRRRSQFFGFRYSGLQQNTIRVPLQQHMVSGWIWFLWLAAYTEMPVLPAVMLPKDDDSVLTIAPPIAVPKGGPVRQRTETLARAFYAYWAEQVSAHPSQWFGWHKFDAWMPTQIESTTTQPHDVVHHTPPHPLLDRHSTLT